MLQMSRLSHFRLALLLLLGVALVGCTRGRPSEEPPIHLNLNMDFQNKYIPQSESEFFANGMTMRLPVPGTVARGDTAFLHPDYFLGLDDRDSTIEKIPIPVDMQLLERGQERFNIYCSPCHGQTGNGQGIVVKRGMLPPPSFHDPRLLQVNDGYIFNVITNGIRNMPSYRHQIPVQDRWAIVSYLRALQRSQNASIEDVPEDMRQKLK